MADSVTSVHIRAGRALIGWSIRDLAKAAGVHPNSVSSFENDRTTDPFKLANMKAALEAAGVEFIYGDRPGVRLVSGPSSSGKR